LATSLEDTRRIVNQLDRCIVFANELAGLWRFLLLNT